MPGGGCRGESAGEGRARLHGEHARQQQPRRGAVPQRVGDALVERGRVAAEAAQRVRLRWWKVVEGGGRWWKVVEGGHILDCGAA